MTQTDLGTALTRIRLEAKRTQYEFAVDLEMWIQSVWHWERGDSIPRTRILREICQLFPDAAEAAGYDYAQLFDLREEALAERRRRRREAAG